MSDQHLDQLEKALAALRGIEPDRLVSAQIAALHELERADRLDLCAVMAHLCADVITRVQAACFILDYALSMLGRTQGRARVSMWDAGEGSDLRAQMRRIHARLYAVDDRLTLDVDWGANRVGWLVTAVHELVLAARASASELVALLGDVDGHPKPEQSRWAENTNPKET